MHSEKETMTNGARTVTDSGSDTTVAPPGFIRDALKQLTARTLNDGNAIDRAGRDLTRQTLNGRFLSPESNPHLQQTFNRAADLTRTRLNSEFAGSGRDLGAAQPARSDELQTLAASLFGDNFARERGFQQQALLSGGGGFNPLDQLIGRISQLSSQAGRDISERTKTETEDKASPLGRILGGLSLF